MLFSVFLKWFCFEDKHIEKNMERSSMDYSKRQIKDFIHIPIHTESGVFFQVSKASLRVAAFFAKLVLVRKRLLVLCSTTQWEVLLGCGQKYKRKKTKFCQDKNVIRKVKLF
jgi:hypothetical protein